MTGNSVMGNEVYPKASYIPADKICSLISSLLCLAIIAQADMDVKWLAAALLFESKSEKSASVLTYC